MQTLIYDNFDFDIVFFYDHVPRSICTPYGVILIG